MSEKNTNLLKPNHEIGVYKVLPTLVSNALKLELPSPYNEFILPSSHNKLFEERNLNVLIISDSVSINYLDGWLLDKWSDQGKLRLSSVFPTTTANVVGSIYIGLPPELSGLVSSKFYVREIGNFIDALFGRAIGSSCSSLDQCGVRLDALLWWPTLLNSVDRGDIYFVDILPNFIRGGLQNFYNENLITISYETTLDAFITLEKTVELLLRRNKRGIVFLYLHHLDSMGHKYGYGSIEWRNEFSELSKLLLNLINRLKRHVERRVSIHLISDHGQINPRNIQSFDREGWDDLMSNLGVEAYTSSDRVFFLYLKEGSDADDVVGELEAEISKHSHVLTIERAIEIGLWSSIVEDELDRFVERIGDVVIIPKNTNVINVEKDAKYEDPLERELLGKSLKGRHGGLTEDELFVPLINLTT